MTLVLFGQAPTLCPQIIWIPQFLPSEVLWRLSHLQHRVCIFVYFNIRPVRWHKLSCLSCVLGVDPPPFDHRAQHQALLTACLERSGPPLGGGHLRNGAVWMTDFGPVQNVGRKCLPLKAEKPILGTFWAKFVSQSNSFCFIVAQSAGKTWPFGGACPLDRKQASA